MTDTRHNSHSFGVRGYTQWNGALSRHWLVLTVVMLVLGAFFSWLSRGIVWDADVLTFFSGDSPAVRDMRAAANSGGGVVGQLRFDVHAAPAAGRPEGVDSVENLRGAARALAESLRGSGAFRQVWREVSESEMGARYARLAAQGPVLLDEAQQRDLFARATAAEIAQRFAAVKARLVDPDGEMLLGQLAADPLGVSSAVAADLAALSPVRGASTAIEGGMLTARDAAGGVHILIVGEPIAPASAAGRDDTGGARHTMAVVDGAVAALRAKYGVDVWVVGAQRAYVENQQRVVRDVATVSTLGTLLVGCAIFVFFARGRRDGGGGKRGAIFAGWRRGASAVIVCMIPPFAGIGVALGIAGIFGAHLPLILLGFAGLLCGSTTDYGIQLAAGCEQPAAEEASDCQSVIATRAARRLFAPITMSVLTSVTGFAALGLSDAPGLRALGLFVAGATLCIWLVTFGVLPGYLGAMLEKTKGVAEKTQDERGMTSAEVARLGTGWRRVGWWVGAVVFLSVTIFFGIGAARVRFNSDPRALDGSSAQMRADEAAFYRVWGDLRNRAVVLVQGGDAAAATELLGRVDDYLQQLKHEGRIADVLSPGAILPDAATAGRRADAWRAYWTEARRGALAQALASAAQANGFRAETFTGYAQRIGEVSPAPVAARLRDSPAALFPGVIDIRTTGASAGAVTIAVVVQMNPVSRETGSAFKDDGAVSARMAGAWAGELRLRFPETTSAAAHLSILSGNLLVFDATERARAEGERLAPWCMLAILVPLWIYFRHLRRAWLVMLCLVAGSVWVLGAAQWWGGGLNLLSLVPVLFTLGVAVDYGIYRARGAAMNSAATFVCALTTILGSGALVFAGHPAMRWLGMTLVAGVTGGYLASVYLVGGVLRWAEVRTLEGGGRAGLRGALAVGGSWSLRVALLLLTLVVAIPPVVELVLSRQQPQHLEARRAHPPVEQAASRAWKTGDNWMRWRAAPAAGGATDSGLWEIMLRGDAQDRGYATAALAGPIDYRIENEMLDQLDYFLPNEWPRWFVLRTLAADMVSLPGYIKPEYQEEIYWATVFHEDPHRYLAPSYPRILSYHALHDISQMLIDNPLIVPNTFACTGVIALPGVAEGHLLLARNFDFEGGESFGRQKSITYVVPPEGQGIPFAHVAWPGLSGVVTGMNREKIALFVNAAATREFRRIGTPTILMTRDILQHARSLAEAEEIIRHTRVFVSDIIVVADGKTGEARVFEKSPDAPGGAASYDVKDWQVVANHLVTAAFINDPVNKERQAEGTTEQREARARQLMQRMTASGAVVTPEKLAGLLRDKRGLDDAALGWGNRNAIDGLIACHGVIMDVTGGKMWVAAWPNVEGAFLGFDVMAMLNGRVEKDADFSASTAPILVGEDSMMDRPATTVPAGSAESLSGWERTLAARQAAAAAAARAGRHDGSALDAMLAAADEAIRLNPDFYEGHLLRGKAFLNRGDKAAAQAEFTEALRLDPPYVQRRNEIEGLIHACQTAP